jgi:hypothetical protein
MMIATASGTGLRRRGPGGDGAWRGGRVAAAVVAAVATFVLPRLVTWALAVEGEPPAEQVRDPGAAGQAPRARRSEVAAQHGVMESVIEDVDGCWSVSAPSGP